MNAKLGPGTDNARRTVVGERSVTIDAPTVLPAPRRGPSEGLVAAVAIITVLLLFGAGLVALRHSADSEPLQASPTPTACWDGSTKGPDGCPKIEGRAALLWLFAPEPDFDSCEAAEIQESEGQLEGWACRWSDVDAWVVIVRWDTTTSAEEYYTFFLGDPRRVPARGGLVFDSSAAALGGEPSTAFAYSAHPYTYIVMGSDVARSEAVSRLHPRPPADIVV